MRPSEELAVLTALKKAVDDRLKEVRAEADSELLEAYDEDGVTKKALKVGGLKVGDYILNLTKETWEIVDEPAFEDFALTYGFAEEAESIKTAFMHRAVELMREECPEGLESSAKVDPKWRDYVYNVDGVPIFMDSGMVVPGVALVPSKPKNTQVRGCKPADVIPRLQALGGVDALLLGAGNSEM